MVELKKEAVKDVASLTKTAPVALAKTKEVLNQAVADYTWPTWLCTKYTGICVVVVSLYGIQKWMSTWKLLMVNWMKSANA